MGSKITIGILIAAIAPALACAQSDRPWLDAKRSPDERAMLALAAMTTDEVIGLLHGPMALPIPLPGRAPIQLPAEAILGAGYVPGVSRLGIPSLYETDGPLGVTNPFDARRGDSATALPSSLALAATFSPQLAYEVGVLLGKEARAKGFNVLLAGGVNLTRDPRNGRNFEYLGEDPLLAGLMAGESVRGTQDQHVISTVKHFVLNAHETNRHTLDARIDRAALRESDLLAFEIAIERGRPGSVMCAYNKVNGQYACGNDWLLNDVLKREWGFKGWVMSDWGAVHGSHYAVKGLDQQSGEQLDASTWFDTPLRAALAEGQVPRTRVNDMARRILRTMFAVGIVDHPPQKGAVDLQNHAAKALEVARSGMVLLTNNGLLPLKSTTPRIALIGGNAHIGVLSGGGSSQVIPANGAATRVPVGGHGMMAGFRNEMYFPSSPYKAIQAAAPKASVLFDSGAFPADAAALAARSDVAIVFVTRHELEGYDIPNLSLPHGQDALVEAVLKANPNSVVVLETGNPVAMPWLDKAAAVLAAWYPGQEGGQAIADILFGAVNPSGRLPMTFPRDEASTVRPKLPNLGSEMGADVGVDYLEGADVGYRWYHKRGVEPLFAFGHGLSYTTFKYDTVKVSGGKTLSVSLAVENVGDRIGTDVPQVYLTSAAGKPAFRLIGFQRVELQPGERRTISTVVDSRLLSRFDEARGKWVLDKGMYSVSVGKSANDLIVAGEVRLFN